MESYKSARFTEVVLVILILLNILDFFKFLPADLDFAKKIISWTLIAILFYKIRFTWLFFGAEKKEKIGFINAHTIDLFILLSFLALSYKNIQLIAMEAFETANFFSPIGYALSNNPLYWVYGIAIGLVALTIISIYLAIFAHMRHSSLLGSLNLNKHTIVTRVFATFIGIMTFYLLVFDLLAEWLAFAVDSLLIVGGILLYMLYILKYHKHYNADSLIYKIGSFGEEFEEHFIKFFHDKEHVFLGITGLLVLHLFTEIGSFMFPYILNLTNSQYFTTLGHEPLYHTFMLNLQTQPAFYLLASYILNIVFVGLLLFLPIFMWYEVYKNDVHRIPKTVSALFYAGMATFLTAPIFMFKALPAHDLIGVDISAKLITTTSLSTTFFSALGIGVLVYILASNDRFKHILYHFTIASSIAFLSYYTFLFIYSLSNWAYVSFSNVFSIGNPFLIYTSVAFIVLTAFVKILFYIFALIKFIIQLFRHHLL